MKFQVATTILMLTLALVVPLRAMGQEESSVLVRLYYSNAMTGKVDKSPLDPNGVFKEQHHLRKNSKIDLELIFVRRLGLSLVRERFHRAFIDEQGISAICATPPCMVEERAEFNTLNITLYAREVTHDRFNLFAGGGSGSGDYKFALDGVIQDRGELFDNLSVNRVFTGFEYTFERIGFRYEYSRLKASGTLQGQTASFQETLHYFIFYIPLN